MFSKEKEAWKSWLVLLAIETKRKVSEVVENFPLELNGFSTTVDLNILPLESYDTLISMDCMEKNRSKMDCYNKVIECFDKEGKPIVVKGFSFPVVVKKVLSLRLSKLYKKGFQIYAV